MLMGNVFPGRFTRTKSLEVSIMVSARPPPSASITVVEKVSSSHDLYKLQSLFMCPFVKASLTPTSDLLSSQLA